MDFLLLAFLWCAVVSLSIPKMSIDAIAFCYPLPLDTTRHIRRTRFICFKKRYLKSGFDPQPEGIIPRVLQSPHVKSQSQEKQHEKACNHLGRADYHRDARLCPVVRSGQRHWQHRTVVRL
jgi:hypothetical protein